MDQAGEELGQVIASVALDETELPSGEFEIDGRQGFEESSGGVVRPAHAEAAAAQPDDWVVLECEGSRMAFATKQVETPAGEFALLVQSARLKNGSWGIQAAFRLYPEKEESAEMLASDAGGAFRVLLERYGKPFESEGRKVRFLPAAKIPNTFGSMTREDAMRTINGLLGLDAKGHWSATGEFRYDQQTITVTWPFAIDLNAYKRDVSRGG
ncbi:MAG TPA: hypothetical protein VFL89_06295 [Solirubrobacterales bacterium]|nr:hypothetical protein [Solirubrobacterales bacterium]